MSCASSEDREAPPTTWQAIAEARERQDPYLYGPLLDLAANVLRVVRGAGTPHSIFRDCLRLIAVYEEYRRKVGEYPSSHTVGEILRFKVAELDLRTVDPSLLEEHHAIEQMTRGALQFAAATLLGQIPQRATGRHDMTDGALRYAKHLEERRASWQGASAAKRRAPARRPKKAR